MDNPNALFKTGLKYLLISKTNLGYTPFSLLSIYGWLITMPNFSKINEFKATAK